MCDDDNIDNNATPTKEVITSGIYILFRKITTSTSPPPPITLTVYLSLV